MAHSKKYGRYSLDSQWNKNDIKENKIWRENVKLYQFLNVDF